MDEAELRRTKEFALRVVRLCGSLPDAAAGRSPASQLVRSGISVGADYRVACKARSRAEFASKLGIVEEEADESAFWLEWVIDARLMRTERVADLLAETNPITRTMTSSRLSVRKGRSSQ
ncbi:MAG: four helix bundle protein [Bacillota bacterium]